MCGSRPGGGAANRDYVPVASLPRPAPIPENARARPPLPHWHVPPCRLLLASGDHAASAHGHRRRHPEAHPHTVIVAGAPKRIVSDSSKSAPKPVAAPVTASSATADTKSTADAGTTA